MTDAFWISLFGFLGVAVVQVFLHLRAMAAQNVNTRITVAAATGRSEIPVDSTQLEEVVKAVAKDKKEVKDTANKVADKVESATAIVRKALNGDMTIAMNDVVAKHVEPMRQAHEEMKEAMRLHQEDDKANMLEVRNSLAELHVLMKNLARSAVS